VLITGASSGIGQALALEIGAAGGVALLVARRRDRLEETRGAIQDIGGVAHVYPCDLSDPLDIDRMVAEALQGHGHVDVLVNNAGRSIRRAVDQSYERFHDFQRTMQLNYFGAIRLILDLLPNMRERKSGHIVNVSTAGVQTSAPMFSAYLASKAALDTFSRSIRFEVARDGITISTVYMPLVRTPMIAPTKAYQQWPALTPEEAAALVCTAIRKRCARVAKPLSTLGQIGYAVAPGRDQALSVAILRLRLGRRWRKVLAAAGFSEAPPSSDIAWREAFRRRLERTQVATDPDEVRRLANLLGTIPLFERCSFGELHRLAATAYPIVFEEGDALCTEGAHASESYVIVEGEATASIQGFVVGTARANDVVGERGPIEDRPRAATVVATTRVLAYAVSRDRLTRLAELNPEAAAHMRRVVRERYGRSLTTPGAHSPSPDEPTVDAAIGASAVAAGFRQPTTQI
jgi:NAD(P)-dependent dehydrogenase (short-subunit alcohol dehydrogenase family)